MAACLRCMLSAGRLTVEPVRQIELAMWALRRICLRDKELTSRGMVAGGAEVQVTIVRGTNFPAADSARRTTLMASGVRSSDPYVLLNGVYQTFKTTCKSRTLDPEWNENFVFFFASTPELASAGPVSLIVKDRDRLLKDDNLGSADIKFHALQVTFSAQSVRRTTLLRRLCVPLQ